MQDGEDRADSDSGVMSREDSPMGQGGDRPPIERPPAIADSSASENDDEELDETLSERLWGLTEMFPEIIRFGVSKLTTGAVDTSKTLYHYSRHAAWIFFSSSIVLVAPILFEMERAQMEEMQRQQQRQILLGPGAAMSGGPPPGGLAVPPPQR